MLTGVSRDRGRLLRLKADNSDTHYNLGVVYIKQNRFDDAIKSLTTSLGIKPDDAESGPTHSSKKLT